jgi:hypothetical protein
MPVGIGGVGGEMDPNRIALYRAADHMQDPQVQLHMQDMLRSDPQGLDELIQNDPELRAFVIVIHYVLN